MNPLDEERQKMQRYLDDDDLDREEEKYFTDVDYEDDFIEDYDELPLGDFDDDEPIDEENDDELINENFMFGDDESYEDEIEEVEIEEDDNQFDFENEFFNSEEEEW